MKKQLKYKFLREGLKSNSGNLTWKIGKWVHEKGKLDICNNGLHCSLYPDQAFSYVQGEILALVETKGKAILQEDKECWSDMRIVKAYKWTKTDSVELAIFAAELVIDIYEKQYPNDDRPRKAIEAAKAYIKDPSRAAYAADAAYAAYAADYAARAAYYAAAYAADYAARAAAYAAGDAARAAAYAAGDAARAAYYAAGDAAYYAADAAYAAYAADREVIVKKIRRWIINRIKKLEEFR
jgi:hypothetical protein